MKKITFLLVFISIFGYAQTAITDANRQMAVTDCLSTNPVDGMCSDSEYGAMPNWDVSSVTNMGAMFEYASSFNADISNWDVSSVTNMSTMFANASSFNRDLSNWAVSSVTEMRVMLGNSALSTENYDALLNGWSQKNIQSNVTLGAQFLSYCNGEDARQSLIDNHNWTINDAGLDCSTAGVDDQKQLDISIYPNPVVDKLFIQGLSDATKISVYDILGKLVLSKTILSEIDVTNLQRGIYTIKIIDEQKETVQKFIKN